MTKAARFTELPIRTIETMSSKNVFVRLFSALWSGADAVRKVLHLVLLLVIFMIFIGALSGGAPPLIPSVAALVIEPQGSLVEQLAGDPFERAISEALGDGEPQTLVQDVVDALEYAKEDDRIEVVYLELSGLVGSGLSKLRRVADAIEDFRESGKKVVANADFMMQQAYYLAAHADEVYLHPDGIVYLQGFGSFRTYYKDAIDLLRIDWNVFRAGTHKTAFETYTRMDMSDEDRETRSRLLEQLWTLYREDVVEARGMEQGAIQAFSENMLDNVRASGGDLAIVAKDAGLIDDLKSRTEIRELLTNYVGENEDEPGYFNAVGMSAYLSQMRMMSGGTVKDENVAVIVAAGDIQFGTQAPGTIGGDSTAALLRKARSDESVKAVVLRVDSPGGSAFASDVIADEIRALKRDGKPVVASMSSVAASGGYHISMDADQIVASPATITGSIGVLGLFPTFQRTMAAIGIAVDGVGTTPWSGEIRPDREMSPHAKELFQAAIEDNYNDFVSEVAAGRGMEFDAVNRIAQGQVWTGVDALENGLVDQLGELDDAIEVAASLAEIDEYGIKHIEQELSDTQQLILDLIEASSLLGIDASAWVNQPTAIEAVVGKLAEQANAMLRFNDPQGVYSHCFCDFW
jgi:protease-4